MYHFSFPSQNAFDRKLYCVCLCVCVWCTMIESHSLFEYRFIIVISCRHTIFRCDRRSCCLSLALLHFSSICPDLMRFVCECVLFNHFYIMFHSINDGQKSLELHTSILIWKIVSSFFYSASSGFVYD